jgi:hypothetical protein
MRKKKFSSSQVLEFSKYWNSGVLKQEMKELGSGALEK